VKALLRAGASVHCKNTVSFAPRNLSLSKMVLLILMVCTSAHFQDGDCALTIAITNKAPKVVRKLLKAGAIVGKKVQMRAAGQVLITFYFLRS
jgi:ankyrin repeat protein